MLFTIVLTCISYTVISIAVHRIANLLWPKEFGALSPKKQLQFDFRGMRVFAGIKCCAFFCYGLFGDHRLGMTGVNQFTSMVFESYLGYTIFELIFMAYCTNHIVDLYTKSGLRLLTVHHILVGGAAYAMCHKSSAPHYLGLLVMGNESVVISYAVIQMATMLGYKDHPLVKINTISLPVQYTIRQFLFYYITYMMFANYDVIVSVCSDWLSYLIFYVGINILGLFINPYWTYQTYEEVFRYIIEERKHQNEQKESKCE